MAVHMQSLDKIDDMIIKLEPHIKAQLGYQGKTRVNWGKVWDTVKPIAKEAAKAVIGSMNQGKKHASWAQVWEKVKGGLKGTQEPQGGIGRYRYNI